MHLHFDGMPCAGRKEAEKHKRREKKQMNFIWKIKTFKILMNGLEKESLQFWSVLGWRTMWMQDMVINESAVQGCLLQTPKLKVKIIQTYISTEKCHICFSKLMSFEQIISAILALLKACLFKTKVTDDLEDHWGKQLFDKKLRTWFRHVHTCISENGKNYTVLCFLKPL